MIEVTVVIVSDVLSVTAALPPIGVTISGIKDDVINGNNYTITDLPI